jgi:uncharacterized Tic20 family protein
MTQPPYNDPYGNQGQPQHGGGQGQPQGQPQYGQPQYGQPQPYGNQGQPQYNDPHGNQGYQPAHGGQQYGAPMGQGMPGAPVGYANSDEKTWALIAHFGGIIGFIPALIAFLVKGSQSPTVRAHSVAALNFQIVVTVAAIVLNCGAFLMPGAISWLVSLLATGVWIVGVVFAIIAGMKANQGQLYRYPIPLQIVK